MNKVNKFFELLSNKIDQFIDFACRPFVRFYNKYVYRDNQNSRNRRVLLFASLIVLLDYLFVCYHVGRNPLDLVPSVPHIDLRDEITVYVAGIDGKTILKEKRYVDKGESDVKFVSRLVSLVFAGSNQDNTRLAVPVSGKIRNIWIFENKCIVDVRSSVIGDDIAILPESEATFKKAVRQTITENVPSIKEVIIAENGIPEKRLWETSFVLNSSLPVSSEK